MQLRIMASKNYNHYYYMHFTRCRSTDRYARRFTDVSVNNY